MNTGILLKIVFYTFICLCFITLKEQQNKASSYLLLSLLSFSLSAFNCSSSSSWSRRDLISLTCLSNSRIRFSARNKHMQLIDNLYLQTCLKWEKAVNPSHTKFWNGLIISEHGIRLYASRSFILKRWPCWKILQTLINLLLQEQFHIVVAVWCRYRLSASSYLSGFSMAMVNIVHLKRKKKKKDL